MHPSAIIGCDGARSQVAGALTGTTTAEEKVPCRLLAVIGVTPPLEPHTIYAGHPRGFAGQMRRGPDLTRFYLEVPAADTLAKWPEDRIAVPMIEPSFVELRMRAAHLITPAGGKDMTWPFRTPSNWRSGLSTRWVPKADSTWLDGYSAKRLPVIRRTQAFSRWMLRMMLAGSDAAGAAEFGG